MSKVSLSGQGRRLLPALLVAFALASGVAQAHHECAYLGEHRGPPLWLYADACALDDHHTANDPVATFHQVLRLVTYAFVGTGDGAAHVGTFSHTEASQRDVAYSDCGAGPCHYESTALGTQHAVQAGVAGRTVGVVVHSYGGQDQLEDPAGGYATSAAAVGFDLYGVLPGPLSDQEGQQVYLEQWEDQHGCRLVVARYLRASGPSEVLGPFPCPATAPQAPQLPPP